MGPKQERAVPLMSPADVSAPHASIPPVTEAHHIVALMKENLFPLLDHWLLPNLLSSRAMEDRRRDGWKEMTSPQLILAHLVWSLLKGKYSPESVEYELAFGNLVLHESEAVLRTIKERGTGSVQDACITSPAALWAAAYPVYKSFPLSHQEMSLLVEEAWHRYTFIDEHWPKSPDEYLHHVSKIERQPHSMLEALGLDEYTYPLFQ